MFGDRLSNNFSNQTLWQKIVIRKFSSPLVIVLVALLSIGICFVIAKTDFATGVLIVLSLIGLPVLYATVAWPEFGIIALFVVAFLLSYAFRFLPEPTPAGVIMDALTWLLILGFFIRQKKERDWSYFKDPVSYWTLIWIGYNIFEIINPASPSILEWVYTVRTVSIVMLLYFVFQYQIRSKQFVKLLIKVWLVLEFISGLSGFQQEHLGLLPWEFDWVHRYPDRWHLLFIGGHLRKWGPFSDPVVYAYNMVAGALICVALLFNKNISQGKKIILGFMAVFFFTVMLYSGTRASYVIVPAAMVMLAILNFNKQVLMFIIAGSFVLAFLIVVPTKNPTLARFQSAFRPSKDRSFEERAKNQKMIKPYILAHPIGGGLGAAGIWGQRFAPESFLAKFPPDSGYVRVAVEMGYVGLLLYCIFTFVIMYTGIRHYYLIKDPELKIYCLAMLLIIFAFDIGNYPQQAIVQYPSNIFYYLAMALLNVLMRLDIKQRQDKTALQTG
jgi:cell division protein FtsW (lipid II flippase)